MRSREPDGESWVTDNRYGAEQRSRGRADAGLAARTLDPRTGAMDTPAGTGHTPNVRTVYDGIHVWTVYEHTPHYDRRGTPTLVFDSPEVVRRVRCFPANWFALPDEDLAALARNR